MKLIAWWGTIIAICMIIALGSTLVTRSYMRRREHEMVNYRPPNMHKLEEDIELTNRDGKKVNLGMLKNKIYIVGYQYTDCPAGCLGMAAIMKVLHSQYSTDPRFHLVSISVNPSIDTPEKMNDWVKKRGIDVPNWWFLTGGAEEISNYMTSHFKLFRTKEITDPAIAATQGKWAHDQRLVLVDGGGNIRGYYVVMDSQRGEDELSRLLRDYKMVMEGK